MSKIKGLALVLAMTLYAVASHADTLLLDAIDQKTAAAGALPARGMTMAGVENSFGRPAARRAPVGQPPITRWEYPGFVVYFEYQHVVHAVARR